jgi:hypothetical protein
MIVNFLFLLVSLSAQGYAVLIQVLFILLIPGKWKCIWIFKKTLSTGWTIHFFSSDQLN